MVTATYCTEIFEKAIKDYHFVDSVLHSIRNPFPEKEFAHLLYLKCWTDTVQWHFEDMIRVPDIDPATGMQLKRQIDKSNQKRTDLVELIDDWFVDYFKEATPLPNAGLNTESPAWVIDRLSILALKIYHMSEEAHRTDVTSTEMEFQKNRLEILVEQQSDLSTSFDQLMEAIGRGEKRMKVYRQMKLYNNPATNPAIYNKED